MVFYRISLSILKHLLIKLWNSPKLKIFDSEHKRAENLLKTHETIS